MFKMEKVVVCQFLKRSKRVKFMSTPAVSDLVNLQGALLSAAESDVHLARLLEENDFVFQTHDPTFDALVDIDVEDVIKDKSAVVVTFIERKKVDDRYKGDTSNDVRKSPVLEFNSLKELTAHLEQHGGLAPKIKDVSSVGDLIKTGRSTDHDDLIKAGQSAEQDDDLIKTSSATGEDDFSMAECSKNQEEEDDIALESDCSDDPGLDDPGNATKCKKPCVPFPQELPSLEGSMLEEYTSPRDIIQHLDKFVRMWASHLCKLTKGKPLPRDYTNYSKSIIRVHPFLGSSVLTKTKGDSSDKANHRMISDKLSACIRRRRNYVKSVVAKKAKKGSPKKKKLNKSPQKVSNRSPWKVSSTSPLKVSSTSPWKVSSTSPLKVSSTSPRKVSSPKKILNSAKRNLAEALKTPAGPQNGKNTTEGSDVQHSLLRELKRSRKNSSHVQMLLKKTVDVRRAWIREENKKPSEVLDEYPAFAHMDVVMYEAQLIGSYKEEVVQENFSKVIPRLADMLEVAPHDPLAVLKALQKELVPKNAPAKYPPALTINKVFGPIKCLMSEEHEPFRLVTYNDMEDISSAYVVGEGRKWSVPNPTAAKCISCLLCSYYVFHRDYPDPYKNLFIFLELKVLGLEASDALTAKLKKLLLKYSA